jgi:PPOX class probable F420-dependent enzyme
MRERVRVARVARLATVDATGRPHLVPFCFVLDGDDLLSAVDAKPKSTTRLRRLDNVRSNPRVSVLVDHYEDDWRRLWWVRLDGRADVLDEGPERDRGLELLAEKYDQYRETPPAGPVIVVEIEGRAAWHAGETGERHGSVPGVEP